MTETTRTRTLIWPTFRYRDAPAAIRFLCDAFGFEEAAVYRGDDERVVAHAELRWPGGGGIMLGSAAAPEDGAPRVGQGSVYCVTEDPDALYARAVAAGAVITRELYDADYGSRGFGARDPEGVDWHFGTYAGAE